MAADPELNTDRKKPCGYQGFCPLIDEHRLFHEGAQALQDAGVSQKESYQFVNTMLSKWCKRLDSIGLHPDLYTCRSTSESAARAVPRGASREQMSKFVQALYKLAREYEKSKGQSLASLADIVLGDLAPF